MKSVTVLIAFLTISLAGYSQSTEKTTQIQWDSWGVPHITAPDVEDLFFAQGWAQMHNHANHILQLYGSSRGKGAEYWGKDKIQNDMLIRTLGFEETAKQWEARQDPLVKKMFNSFVAGMNAYASSNPDAIDENNRVVLPVTTRDLNMHAMYVIFTRFIGGSELGRTQQWPDMGSNTYAIGPSRSASGNAMLVQNPHLPWFGEFMFFESHLNLAGKNMYGVTLVGFPGIAIGFNENLGWSHTDNTLDNADTYEVELNDGGYLLDGQRREFKTFSETITVKQEDGSLTTMPLEVQHTVHGPVIKKSADKAIALRMVGQDRPNMFLQWWRMINSQSLGEFEDALKMAQIPFWNVMYADKQGEIFYLFNGLVPRRNTGDWNFWNSIIKGGRSADVWNEVHPYADLPKVHNPEGGWLQNANDPPWTSTVPMTLRPGDFPSYMAPEGMPFRPQRAAKMIMNDESVTFEELLEYKLSTRLEVADRLLDDLFDAIDRSDSEKARRAKAVLMDWDRSADADSKGTVLFYSWASKFNVWRSSNYITEWDPENPVSTPDGIADPDRAIALLEEAVTETETVFGKLDVAWGEFYRLKKFGKDLPANGIDGGMGVFRVAWPGGREGAQMYVGGGDSWVGVIEFGEKVQAKVLLSYGNATQDGSPHRGDQLYLFSGKKMRDAWFYETDLAPNVVKVEEMNGEEFIVRK